MIGEVTSHHLACPTTAGPQGLNRGSRLLPREST
jgi:hypothetical protein